MESDCKRAAEKDLSTIVEKSTTMPTSGVQKIIVRIKLTMLVCAALVFVGFSDPLLLWSHGQETNKQNTASPPQQAIWRPTKPTLSGGQYLGAQACARCHANKVATHKTTPMGRALETVVDCQILRAHPQMTYKLGPYSYSITRRGEQSFYTVTDGATTISEPILHCFGQGKAGQTYVLKHNNSFYESRLSFYNDIDNLDITIGYPRTVPASLDEALGRLISPDEVRSCYACHSTASVMGTQLQLDKLMPGVSCEACHGPGEKHVLAMKAGNYEDKNIFNPAKLGGDELTQEFCASCHRSAEDVSLMPNQAGINNVRFQPYRIFNSACYADDRRISCTACHNPHEDLKHDVAFYDTKCLACHTTTTSADLKGAQQDDKRTASPCPVQTKNCTSCHMPKIELPGSHTAFTDHRIRVVKAGEVYPK